MQFFSTAGTVVQPLLSWNVSGLTFLPHQLATIIFGEALMTCWEVTILSIAASLLESLKKTSFPPAISINSETLPLFTGKVVESLGFSEPSEEYIRYVENSSFLLLNKYKEKYGDIFASTKKIICVRKSNNKSNIDFNNPLSVHINYYIVEQTNEYNEKDHILDIIYGEITGLDINEYLLSRINNHDDFNDLHEDFEGYDGVKWLIDNEYVYREIFELFDYVLDFD